MMDSETVRWGITGFMGLIMWLWKRTIDANEKAIEQLEHDVQTLKETRVHKEDLKEFKIELRGQFEEIKQALRDLKFRAE